MSLVERQWLFLQNIAKLIEHAKNIDIILTAGEAYRTEDQQLLYYYGRKIIVNKDHLLCTEGRKLTWTMHSKHLKRLAMDFNFFYYDDKGIPQLTYDKDFVQPLGDYWESLHPDNVWGGNWIHHPDIPHFEMKG